MRRLAALALALASLAAGCFGTDGPPAGAPADADAPVTGNATAPGTDATIVPPPSPRQCAAPYDCTDARRDDPALPTFERFEKKVRLSGLDAAGSLDFAPSHPWRAYRLDAWTETAGEGAHESRALSLYRPYAILLGRAEGVGRLAVALNSTALPADETPFRLRVASRVPVATEEMLTLVAEVRYEEARDAPLRLAQGNGYVGFRDVDDHDLALWDVADALVVRVSVTDDARALEPDHAFALVAPDGSVGATAGAWGGEMRAERPARGLWTLRATGGSDPTGGVTFGFAAVALLPPEPPRDAPTPAAAQED